MPNLSDLFPTSDTTTLPTPVVKGIIATTPAALETTVEVTIPSYDRTLRWGPCKFNRNITAAGVVQSPVRGNDCLVIFDNDREVQILTWWA